MLIKGIRHNSHGPQRIGCKRCGADNRSLAVLSTRLASTRANVSVEMSSRAQQGGGVELASRLAIGRTMALSRGRITPALNSHFGLRPFSRAISKGNGREACDDPAVRFSSRGGVESRHAAQSSSVKLGTIASAGHSCLQAVDTADGGTYRDRRGPIAGVAPGPRETNPPTPIHRMAA